MKNIIINKNDSGQRLDRFLSKAFPDLSHGIIRKSLREKNIKINRKRTAAQYILSDGDRLDLYIKDELLNLKKAKPISKPLDESNIIYEDKNLLIIDKPIGISVHEDQSGSQDTLINQITAYLIQKNEYIPTEFSFSPALCNRIDHNTSGIIIAAKNAETLRIMSEKIRERQLKKLYLCLVYGSMPKKSDTLTAYLKKNGNENKVYISDKKTSENLTITTAYKVISENNGVSLVEVDLLTGRTHQIRAHLAYLGHPILGDPKYGNNKINREHRFKTQALCSYKLKFEFKTNSGILEYLNNKEFRVKNVWFLDKNMCSNEYGDKIK